MPIYASSRNEENHVVACRHLSWCNVQNLSMGQSGKQPCRCDVTPNQQEMPYNIYFSMVICDELQGAADSGRATMETRSFCSFFIFKWCTSCWSGSCNSAPLLPLLLSILFTQRSPEKSNTLTAALSFSCQANAFTLASADKDIVWKDDSFKSCISVDPNSSRDVVSLQIRSNGVRSF